MERKGEKLGPGVKGRGGSSGEQIKKGKPKIGSEGGGLIKGGEVVEGCENVKERERT